MARKIYDMGKLAENNLLDTSVTTWFFYNYEEYFKKLSDYTETYTQFLRNYHPTVVVVSEEEKKAFIQDCAGIRATLTQLGMTSALNELNNMENAVLAGAIKELSDGLTKFHATLEIYANHIANAEERVTIVKPEVMAVSSNEKKLRGLVSLLEESYTVTVLSSGGEAVAALSNHEPPAMFFLSTDMAGINGYELAFIIREQIQLKTTPIFFLTEEKKTDPVRELLIDFKENYIQLPVTDKKKLLQTISKRGDSNVL